MIHGTMICSEGIVIVGVCGIYLAWYETPAEVVCKMVVFEWYGMSGGLTMWQMYMIFLHLVNAGM